VQQNTPLGTLPCTYSITSSARPSNESGKLIPSVLAVLALITNLTLVPCITGRSAGFSPLRIRLGVHAHLSIRISIAESVAHQAANHDEVAQSVNRGHPMMHSQRGELYDPASEERVAIDEECVGPAFARGSQRPH
jgi:hypothetical protein